MCRYPGRFSTGYRIHLCRGFLQARHRLHLCADYCNQEPLGLWAFALYHKVERQRRLRCPYYDEHVSERVLVFLWDPVLVQG